ncbi:unnamed protein product, partial [Rotaria sp. Silwood2]
MTDQTLLVKARKARFDDLPNFSGHPSEDVERFLKSIKNMTNANDESDNHEILEIVRGKLTQSAEIWFDNNENKFNKWANFETAFRNRYFSTTMMHKKFDTLKQRKQLYDEPVTSYFDDVVNLCREIDPAISEQIIIQHLMSGVNPDFKKELSRRESSMNTLNEFLKYTIITNSLSRLLSKSHSTIALPSHINKNTMADQTLLAKARKARFDDLPNFSGHPSEDVERFLKSIKNITKANDESDNHEILEIVRGKLTQSAGIWFDNNENKFNKWADFETAFRNRYFSTTMIHKKFDTLKQRKQLYDEPVTSYFDDVVNLCREIDPAMSEQIIIQHLMSGVNPDFKKELSRRESSMNTLNEFLKY